MRAIRVHAFGDPEAMAVEEIAVPVPGPGECLVRLRAAGVNPVDTYIRSGRYAKLPALPYTPGIDGAGIIEACAGPGTAFSPGTRVYVAGSRTGTYAELAVCAADQVHPLPAFVPFTAGAAIGVPYATARLALLRARASAGETLLVHGGSGSVGLASIQFGRRLGLRVLATAGTAPGRELAEAAGAERVFDHCAAGYEAEVLEATGGAGADVILEMAAHVNLGRDLGLLARGGRVAVVGSRGRVELDPRDAMVREAAVFGVMLALASAAERAVIHAEIGAGMLDGSLRPVVRCELPLEAAPEAHRLVLAPGALGKVVLSL